MRGVAKRRHPAGAGAAYFDFVGVFEEREPLSALVLLPDDADCLLLPLEADCLLPLLEVDCLLPDMEEPLPAVLLFLVSCSLLLPPFLPAWVGLLIITSKSLCDTFAARVIIVKQAPLAVGVLLEIT
jgi:hypothetical protein